MNALGRRGEEEEKKKKKKKRPKLTAVAHDRIVEEDLDMKYPMSRVPRGNEPGEKNLEETDHILHGRHPIQTTPLSLSFETCSSTITAMAKNVEG